MEIFVFWTLILILKLLAKSLMYKQRIEHVCSPLRGQGQIFIAAKFRVTATNGMAKFRGNFAARITDFAGILR